MLFVSRPIHGCVFFQNVGTTLRRGVNFNTQLKTNRLLAGLAYSYFDATFQPGFTESSENNPVADANGNIQIQLGNHLPDIPSTSGSWALATSWPTLGLSGGLVSRAVDNSCWATRPILPP